MQFPLTTGSAAQVLGTTERRLAETVRRGHVSPPPTILAGRRLWTLDQVLQAAEALGILDDNSQARIEHAFGVGSPAVTSIDPAQETW
jgi:hypothetical protein